MRRALFSTLVLFLTLGAAGTVLACDCRQLTPSESLEEADFVFEGEIIRSYQSGHNIAYDFRVRNVFKGAHVDNVTLIEGLSDCDANFSPALLYRVYARSFEGRLSSGTCFANVVLGATRITNYHAAQSTSVWQLRYTKLIAIAGIGLLAILIIRSIRGKSSTG